MEFDITVFISDHITLLFLLAALGISAGFLAGLLGVGGGIVLVPGLFYSFTALGFDSQYMMHMAVGTSLAVIIPTGISSAWAHFKKDGVRVDLVRQIGLGIVPGVLCGTWIADRLDVASMQVIFAVALMVLAMIMMVNPARFTLRHGFPRQPWPFLGGGVIGSLSSLMGIGGATISVPFMSLCGVSMHRAVGTASALGLVISIPAALGYVWIGQKVTGLPPLSLGYVNFLAWGIIVPFSVIMAPMGARAAHALPVTLLRIIFVFFIIAVALRMLWDVFGHG